MLLECDKIISDTDTGDKIGVYEKGTNGKKIFFECEPTLARKLVELHNKFQDYVDENSMMKAFIVKSICREDLKDYLTAKEIKQLDDYDMEYIADKLGDALGDTYWISLDTIIDDRIKPKLKWIKEKIKKLK